MIGYTVFSSRIELYFNLWSCCRYSKLQFHREVTLTEMENNRFATTIVVILVTLKIGMQFAKLVG